jgi:2-hydroxy-6-oxonona-2,4-dienedioate hydrolase
MPSSRDTLQSTFVHVGGLRLHARVSVDPVPDGGPTVVLVHGLAVSSLYMIPTARMFAPHYRVYAPDLPGFGRSDAPDHVLDIGELAEALCDYLDVVGIRRATIIANSLGCQIAAEFAVRHPDRFDRAIFIGPTMDQHARVLWRQAGRLALDALLEPWSQKLAVGYDYLRTGLHRTVQTAMYGLAHHLEEVVARIDAPLLIVRGVNDPIAPQRWCEELAAAAPQGRFVTIRRSAHTVNWDEPDDLLTVARPFFSKEEQSTKRKAENEHTNGCQ